jgi:glycosyltransferase involved in cell wall biosynthesis
MSATPASPDLAVVVIGLGAPPELVEAVRSLEAQDMPAEIVVVNSGGGGAAALLARAGIRVPVHETAKRLYVGEARNIGIGATSAPFIAFLASDCRAAPGWVAERVRLHRAGVRAVASAVLPDAPDNRVSWAHQLLLFPRRLPGLDPADALRYGASYDRRLFDEVGLFDGSLRTGEDTEFAARLPEPPAWAPGVVTLHRNALRVGELLRDQFSRGRRYYAAMHQLRGARATKLARQSLREPGKVRPLFEAGLNGRNLELARASLPLVRLGSLAKALGILAEAGGVPRREAP